MNSLRAQENSQIINGYNPHRVKTKKGTPLLPSSAMAGENIDLTHHHSMISSPSRPMFE
jgi:hypothetical protein